MINILRSTFALLVLATANASTVTPRANIVAAWATGYALAAEHFCRTWAVDLEAVHRDRGLPPFLLDGDWGPGGPGIRAFKVGGLAGQAEFEHRADFCAHPLTSLSEPQRDEVTRFLHPYIWP